jgi:hypothetical protein
MLFLWIYYLARIKRKISNEKQTSQITFQLTKLIQYRIVNFSDASFSTIYTRTTG